MFPARSGKMRLVASRTLRVEKVWHIGVLAAVGFLLFLCVCWPTGSSLTADPIYFLSLGDFGSGSEIQKLVAQQMSVAAKEKQAKFVVSLGDNVYPRGVSGVDDPLFNTVFEDVYTRDSLKIPWYMSLGDHDHRGSVSAQLLHSNSSAQWRMRSQYYKVGVPLGGPHTMDIIITDSVALEAGKEHLKWLEKVLHNSTADWLMVVGHRPIVTCANRPRFPSEQRFSEMMQALMYKYNVDVYIHGHDHIGQHSEVEGVLHIGNGVGGYGNHPATPTNVTVWMDGYVVRPYGRPDVRTYGRVEESVVIVGDISTGVRSPSYSGFVIHKVTPVSMDFKFVASNGTILHSVHVAQKWVSRVMRKRRS